ncbi:hypothetical protein BH10PAT3_BH10PAT3_0700 [soil metagenome]
MGAFGSIVGFQEGIEAGLVTGGLASSEHNMANATLVGLGATALGVAAGHQAGEALLTGVDLFIGDGGVGFIPATAIGASVTWHNLRSHAPQAAIGRTARKLPYIAGASFALFEGIESGILTSSTQSSLLYAEAVTLSAAAATVALFGGIKILAMNSSPRNALRAARGVALIPATYLAAKATPELIDQSKPAGISIAVLGTVALAGAVTSFFRK